MEQQPSFSSTLYDCATECALKRLKRKCKLTFGSRACNGCRLNINKYINADPRHVDLFMLQAESRAADIKSSSNDHRIWFILGIIICLLLARYYHDLGVRREWHEPVDIKSHITKILHLE